MIYKVLLINLILLPTFLASHLSTCPLTTLESLLPIQCQAFFFISLLVVYLLPEMACSLFDSLLYFKSSVSHRKLSLTLSFFHQSVSSMINVPDQSHNEFCLLIFIPRTVPAVRLNNEKINFMGILFKHITYVRPTKIIFKHNLKKELTL